MGRSVVERTQPGSPVDGTFRALRRCPLEVKVRGASVGKESESRSSGFQECRARAAAVEI